MVKALQMRLLEKVGYPNIFLLKICFSGGQQTMHKVPAASIIKNCHPRTSLTLIFREVKIEKKNAKT